MSGKIAYVFPGQGSQYTDMLSDLAIHFPEIRKRFEVADRILADRFPGRLSSHVFPPPRFSEDEKREIEKVLTRTDVAQPALGAADMGLFYLIKSFGLEPHMVAGHSYGEYVALCAAGVFSEEKRWSSSLQISKTGHQYRKRTSSHPCLLY